MFRPRPNAAGGSSKDTGQGAAPANGSQTAGTPATTDGVINESQASLPGIGEESFISRMMADNPYFSAGAGLMGIGVVLTVFRRSVTLASTLAQRRMLVTLEIPSKDRSYPWFLEWMSIHAPQPQPTSIPASAAESTPAQAPSGGISSLWKGKQPMSLRSHELAVETTYKQHENGASEAVFNLVPGPGTHYFKFRGSWFQVKRERDAKLMDLHSGSPWETLTLTTLSTSRHLFPILLSEARSLAEEATEGKTVVYTAWGVEWRPFGKPRRRREMGSVVLADGVAERVEKDLKGFLGRGKWYAERGIPYRRGYLLHGPPGSGKTSFIQALAGSLNYNICLLNLAERGLTDDKLNHLLGLVPDRSIILLEDVDSAFNRRVQTSEDGYKSSVTFSGLLNALDGVASSEERIIFMTTNHFSHLDPALIRPGRVDLQEFLDDAEGEQAKRLFIKFYSPSADEKERTWREDEEVLSIEEVKRMGEELEVYLEKEKQMGRRISMASLQGLFIRNGARETLGSVKELFAEKSAGEVE